MRSRTLGHLAAFHRHAALVLAGMFCLGSGAYAEGDGSHHGLQGTWRLMITVRNCATGEALRTFPALSAFAKGGTLSVTTAGQSPAISAPGLGVWQHTEGQSYRAVFETFVFSPAGAWIQTHRITHRIEIGDDADAFTDTVRLEIFGTEGNLLGTGCGTAVASRFE
jgi:hypothetical protein